MSNTPSIQIFPQHTDAADWFEADGYAKRLPASALSQADNTGAISITYDFGMETEPLLASTLPVLADFLHLLDHEGCGYHMIVMSEDPSLTTIVSSGDVPSVTLAELCASNGVEVTPLEGELGYVEPVEDVRDDFDSPEVLNRGLVRWDGCDTWGVAIEYDPEIISYLQGKTLTPESEDLIVREILRNSTEADASYVLEGLCMDDFQWTTGIDFGHEKLGGGYDISFGWGDFSTKLAVLVEYYDRIAEAEGHDERKDLETCVRIGMEVLRDFLANLPKE